MTMNVLDRLYAKFQGQDPYAAIASVAYCTSHVTPQQRELVKVNAFMYSMLESDVDIIMTYLYAGKFLFHGTWPRGSQ